MWFCRAYGRQHSPAGRSYHFLVVGLHEFNFTLPTGRVERQRGEGFFFTMAESNL
jgi:hypothetical protein